MHELLTAGFIHLIQPHVNRPRLLVVVPEEVIPFSRRIRGLARYRLTTPAGVETMKIFCNQNYDKSPLLQRFHEVLKSAGKPEITPLEDDLYNKYFLRFRWTAWVAAFLKDALADRVLQVVWAAEMPLTRTELAALLPEHAAEQVETAIRQVAGAFGAVRGCASRYLGDRAGSPVPGPRGPPQQDSARRPARPASVRGITQLAPPGGMLLDDLRVLLLEVAENPPRLKVDNDFFQKEEQRLLAALPEWPDWLAAALKKDPDRRLSETLSWARCLNMVTSAENDTEARLHLAKAGRQWLGSAAEEQYALLYTAFADLGTKNNKMLSFDHGSEDTFLGIDAAVLVIEPKQAYYSPWKVSTERRLALRRALDKAFALCRPRNIIASTACLPIWVFPRATPC